MVTWSNGGIPLIAALIGAVGGVVGGLWGARLMARSDRHLARAERLRALYGPIMGYSLALRSYLGAIAGEVPADAPREAFERNAQDVERRRGQCIDAVGQLSIEGVSPRFGECLNRLLEAADACGAAAIRQDATGAEAFKAAAERFDAVAAELHGMMNRDLVALDPLPTVKSRHLLYEVAPAPA
jgi:hypothetical protein